MLFLIAALRAIIEMLLLCLLGQGALYLLAGEKRHGNPVYQLFALITGAPQRWLAKLLPATSPAKVKALFSFLVLLFLWLGLAFARKFL